MEGRGGERREGEGRGGKGREGEGRIIIYNSNGDAIEQHCATLCMQDGCTPLIVHSERGNNSVVMELCKQGALVNAQDKVSVVTSTDYTYLATCSNNH